MSAQDLADRLDEIGYPLKRGTLAQIESGGTRARRVTLEDVFAIAFALGVSPLFLMTPYSDDRVEIADNVQPVGSYMLRGWLRGEEPLLDEDRATFYRHLPPEELDAAMKRARSIETGGQTDSAAFALRQEMIERGDAEPLTVSEGAVQRVASLPDAEILQLARGWRGSRRVAAYLRQATDPKRAKGERQQAIDNLRNILVLEAIRITADQPTRKDEK